MNCIIPTEKHDDIVALYSAGHSTREIGAIYGCSWSTIVKVLKSKGVFLKKQTLSDEQKKDIVDLYVKGGRTKDIAAKYRSCAPRIVKILKQNHVELRITTTGLSLTTPSFAPRPCKKCGVLKPIEQFAKHNKVKTGYGVLCLICENERCRAKTYLKQFNISVKQYDELLLKQSGGCAICGVIASFLENGRSKRLAVDHCHTTGQVRGLLCENCNRGLGLFKDEPERLKAAIVYLSEC